MADRGLPAASLRTVADRAAVSVGRVQHYFSTRERLLEAGFDRANERSSDRIAVRLGGDPERAPARQILEVVLTELVPHDPFSWLHLRVRQSYVARGLNDDRIAARLRVDYARLHERLGAAVRREHERGATRPITDPIACATRLVAHAEGLANHVLLGVVEPEWARGAVRADVEGLYVVS